MHAISNYRGGNRPNTHTNKQTTDRTDYNTLRRSSLARSVITTDVLRAHLWQVYWVYSSIVNWLHQQVRYLYAVASETICKWGGQNAGAKRRPKNFWCAPSLFYCAPHMRGGTTFVCYRLRDNWSGEVGRGAIKVMRPSTYSYSSYFSRSLDVIGTNAYPSAKFDLLLPWTQTLSPIPAGTTSV